MKSLAARLLRRIIKHLPSNKGKYIFYKIVDKSHNLYTIQCINTKAIFNISLVNLAHDIDLLQALHPVQACYLGIEYSKYIKTGKSKLKTGFESFSSHSLSRYGRFIVNFQDRNNYIGFTDKFTNETYLKHSSEIAFSSLIHEFDANDAFLIGTSVVKNTHSLKPAKSHHKPKLVLIK